MKIGHIAPGEMGCTVSGTGDTWSALGDWSATHHG
jgi:phosphoribosylformylglycinamidine cyclo-ligase